jgi:hypothetical protein
MKKNQKYSKEETCPSGRRVYQAIEIWQESRGTQVEFCERERIPVSSFYHWVKRYNQEREMMSLYL